jgi:hypothetical protein
MMKSTRGTIAAFLLIPALCLVPRPAAAAARPSDAVGGLLEQPVTGELDFAHMPLNATLEGLGRISGYTFVLDPDSRIDTEQPVTGHLRNVPLRAVVDALCRVASADEPLGWTLHEKTITIATETRLWLHWAVPMEYRNVPPEVIQFADEALGLARHGQPPAIAGSVVTFKAPMTVHPVIDRVVRWSSGGVRRREWDRLADLKKRLHTARFSIDTPAVPFWNPLRALAQRAAVPLMVDERRVVPMGIRVEKPIALRAASQPADQALATLFKIAQQAVGIVGTGADQPFVDVIGDGDILCVTDGKHLARHVMQFDARPQDIRKLGLTTTDVRKNPALFADALQKALRDRVEARGDTLGKMAVVGFYRLMCYASFETLQEISTFLGQEPGSGLGLD